MHNTQSTKPGSPNGQCPIKQKDRVGRKRIFTERRTTWNEIFSRNWLEKISGSDECAGTAKAPTGHGTARAHNNIRRMRKCVAACRQEYKGHK